VYAWLGLLEAVPAMCDVYPDALVGGLS